MTRVIPLSGNTVARNNPLYILADLQNSARTTITCVSRETRRSTRFATIYIVVYLRANANGRILVLDKYAIIRYWRKIILLQSNLAEFCADKSTWTQCSNLLWRYELY